MNLKKETQDKIQELQNIEQNLHSLLMQKQTFEIELSETENALSEIGKSNEEVYKLIGQIMVKSNKDTIEKELKKKQELLLLRMNSIEKQEKTFSKQAEEIRSQVMKDMK